MKIVQHLGRNKKVFELTDSGLKVTSYANTPFPSEQLFPFENIRSDHFFYKHKSILYLIYGSVLIVLYATVLVNSIEEHTYTYLYNMAWGIGGFILVALYFFHRPKVYFLKTFEGKYIKFSVKKDSSDVHHFIGETIKRRNEYLRLKYCTPNEHLSYDQQYSNFNILQREGVITMEEYQEKIELLNKLFNRTLPTNTFFFYSQN